MLANFPSLRLPLVGASWSAKSSGIGPGSDLACFASASALSSLLRFSQQSAWQTECSHFFAGLVSPRWGVVEREKAPDSEVALFSTVRLCLRAGHDAAIFP